MSARSQVTITLGHIGQVVKRSGPTTDVSHSDYLPSSEGKRPIRERLGSNTDNSNLYGSQSRSKRQRTEDPNRRSGDDHYNDDKQYASNRRVGRNDLRLKLIDKSLSRRNSKVRQEQNEVDLREKLSRNTQAPMRFDAREHVPESRPSGLVRRVPPPMIDDDLLHSDSLRKSYTSWTLEGLRRRSPERLLGTSRGILSPPRNYNELRYVPSVRSLDASRSTNFMTNGGVDASRPATYMSKPTIPIEAAKPVSRAPPLGTILSKSSYTPEEPPTVSSLLNSLGLGKYAIIFQAEEVDMTALKQMGDIDLKELGIPMGPRKKIILAVSAHSKQRHRSTLH